MLNRVLKKLRYYLNYLESYQDDEDWDNDSYLSEKPTNKIK